MAILLDTETTKCVTQIECHEDRILQVTLKASPVNIKIIQVHVAILRVSVSHVAIFPISNVAISHRWLVATCTL